MAGGSMTEARTPLLIALLASLSLSACQPSTEDASPVDAGGPADLVLRGGLFFTLDRAQAWAEAVAIKDGRFVYVGDNAGAQSFVGPDTERHDLDGRLSLPGLVDSHTHPGLMGRVSAGYIAVPVGGGPRGSLPRRGTAEEVAAAVQAYAEANPELSWIEMGSWSNHVFGKAGPHKRDLDRVVPDRPVMLGDDTGHSVWVNSRALELMGVDRNTPDPVPDLSIFVRDADGEPTGWIKEFGGWPYARPIAAKVDRAINKEGMATFLAYLAELGVTTLLDAGNFDYHELTYSLAAELEAEGRLPVRYEAAYHIFLPEHVPGAIDELLRLRRDYGGERLTFNTIKFHFDGTDELRTGAVLEPFSDDPGNRGATLLDTEQLTEFIVELHEARLDLHLHIMADRGVRIALDAVEAAGGLVDGDLYPRVTICHLDIIDPADYPRFRQLGVIANYTPPVARARGPTACDRPHPRRGSFRANAAGAAVAGRRRVRDVLQRCDVAPGYGARQPLPRHADRPQPPVPRAGRGGADQAADERAPGPGGSGQGVHHQRRLSAPHGGPAGIDRGGQACRSGGTR